MASIELFLCGDVMTGRGIDQILHRPSPPQLYEDYIRDARDYVELAERKNGPIPRDVDPDYIWGDALEELRHVAPDARIVNLETAVTRADEPWPGKGINYRMHPDNVGCLSALGIDVCVLANNHVLDWGRPGLSETLETLRLARMTPVGAGRDRAEAEAPAVVAQPKGGRILVFAVGHGSSGIPASWAATPERSGIALVRDLSADEASEIARRASRARRPGDIVVVSIHWGTNWGHDIPDDHVRFARALVDGGIDVVHGHSSHHPRTMEIHRGKPILYGCGDLVNDYEGIQGLERDGLAAMYFVRLEVGERGPSLVGLRIVPMFRRKLRLERASRDAAELLAAVTRRLGADVTVSDDDSVRLVLTR